MKLNHTFYALVKPNGDIVTPYESKFNGLYPTKRRAEALFRKELKLYEEGIQYFENTNQTNNIQYQQYRLRLSEIRTWKVVPVQVVQQE